MRRLLPLVFLVTAACAAGLADVLRRPEVHLDRVEVRGLGLTGGNLGLVLHVYNPNQFTLRGTAIRLGFDVEDAHVGDVTWSDAFTLQQGDTSVVTLPLSFTWSGVGSAVRTALEQGDIPYTMNGELTVETPIGPQSFDFTRDGRVPLVRALETPRGR